MGRQPDGGDHLTRLSVRHAKTMGLPSVIKAEVKLTTGNGVQVSSRELEALQVDDPTAAGILAVLFWCGDRDVDGSWVLVDAARLRGRAGDSFSANKNALVLASRANDGLGALRAHVATHWPAFLEAFKDEALGDHASLIDTLARCHREGLFPDRLPEHAVLAVEHRATVRQVIEAQGESGAGRIMQDLLAYLLAFAGYRGVTNNAVGVPDFVLSDLEESTRPENVVFELTPDQAERLLALCESAGDDDLARVVSRFSRV